MSRPRTETSQEGRLAALRDLVAIYGRPLTRYFDRRAMLPHDVPDLVQEVFLRLSRINDPSDLRLSL